MKPAGKISVVATLVVAVMVTIGLRERRVHARPDLVGSSASEPLPRLVDVGAGVCVACKMMVPVLEELDRDYGATLRVEYIDIMEDREAMKRLDVGMIPTQIFFDAEGNELFRHEGFYPKADILRKWKELGVEL